MEPDLNTSPQKSEIKYPEGYENWSMDDKQKFDDNIQKLKSLGIKSEIVEAQMGLAMYDETEKTLRIRQDADADFIEEYIQNTVLKEQEGIDELPDPGELEDIHVEDDEEENEEEQEEEEVHEETNTPEIVEIKEVTDKNGEVIKIGDEVGWDNASGRGQGKLISFDKTGAGQIKASVDMGVDGVVEIFADELSIVSAEEITPPSPLLQQEGVAEANDVPEWQKGEEWERLSDLRKQAIREELEQRKSGVLGLNLKWQDYENQKQLIEDKIKKTLREKVGENLTAEQENELKKEIQNTSYVELIEKEEKARHKDERDIKGEKLTDKVLEQAKYLLNTKVLQWYFKQNKWTRLGITTGIATVIGMGVGNVAAGGALTYGGYRLARGAASFGAAGAANKWAQKKWSIDEINKEEEQALQNVKASDTSLVEKSELYRKIKEEADKERKRAAGKKLLTTIGVGAGAGLLSGLTEHIVVDSGEMAKSVVDTEPVQVETPAIEINSSVELIEPIKSPIPTTLENVEVSEPDAVSVSEKLFEDPSVLKHEAVAGDSTWKILKGTLENNEQFKGMTEAQKTYVLSNLTNKVLQNPENYGLNKAGSLNIGDKTDFTKLFENTKEVNGVFAKAKETIMEGSAQEKSILLNNEKIAAWVEAHPNESLNEDRVTEILNSKPEVKVAPVTEVPTVASVIPTPKVLEMSDTPVPEPAPAPRAEPEPQPQANNASDILNEIEEAKKRLQVLEGGRGMRSMMGDISMEQGVEQAFRDEINSIYEQSGFLGFGKTMGINTKEWGEMARLPASKVVEYYTGDSAKSGLPDDVVEKLANSKNHNALMRQTVGLMEQANGAVKPFENENMEQFIRRLGGYVLKTYSQNLPKAA